MKRPITGRDQVTKEFVFGSLVESISVALNLLPEEDQIKILEACLRRLSTVAHVLITRTSDLKEPDPPAKQD